MVGVDEEVLHEPAHGIGTQLCIGINAHYIFRIGMGDAVVECRRLAAIGLAEDMHPVVAVESLMDALQRVVLAAVVDKDDIERRIVLSEQRLDRAHAVDFLVVGRHDDRDVRCIVLGQCGIVTAALTALLHDHEIVHEAKP